MKFHSEMVYLLVPLLHHGNEVDPGARNLRCQGSGQSDVSDTPKWI